MLKTLFFVNTETAVHETVQSTQTKFSHSRQITDDIATITSEACGERYDLLSSTTDAIREAYRQLGDEDILKIRLC